MNIIIFNKLCDELLREIYSYIISSNLYMCKRFNFINNNIIYLKLNKSKYESYVRFIIRNDYSFLFKKLLHYKESTIHMQSKIAYKNINYKSEYELIKHHINAYESSKCKKIIT